MALEIIEEEITAVKNDVKKIFRHLERIDRRLRDIEEGLGKVQYTQRIRKCNPFDNKKP